MHTIHIAVRGTSSSFRRFGAGPRHVIWLDIMRSAYDDHRAAMRRKEETFFTKHAGDNPTEFFADATESFYCSPIELGAEYPDIYEMLQAYFRVDPAAWFAVQP